MLAVKPSEVERLEARKRNQQYAGGARILMPTATPITTGVNPAQGRVPKLAVRNRDTKDDTRPDTASTTQSNSENGSSERLALEPRPTNRSQEFMRPSSQRLDSRDGLPRSSEKDQSAAKKKKGSKMLGFLTLKEPSTSAWEELAQQQKKAAAQKGGRSATVGLPGVSSQKLPDFVPKTNSAWDGLPESSRLKTADTKARSQRMSTISASTKISTSTGLTSRSGKSSSSDGSERSAAQKFGSLTSKVPRPQSTALSSKRTSVQSSTSTVETRRFAPQGTTPTAVHPALRDKAVTPWEDSVTEQQPTQEQTSAKGSASSSTETFLHPPTPPPVLPEPAALLPSPGLGLADVPHLEGYDGTFNAQPSPDESPRTPSLHERLKDVPGIQSQLEYFVPDPSPSAATGDSADTFWHSETDTEDAAPKAKPFRVSRSASVNFSRPRIIQPAPTIHEDGIPPTVEEDEEEELEPFVSNLRDETGKTSPFIFNFGEDPYSSDMSDSGRKRRATHVSSTLASLATTARRDSTASRLTAITSTTATTVPPPMSSPTLSAHPSESTRPTTAGSTASAATTRRRSSQSPVRSNSDAQSLASSVMSMQWTMSPKERLGLGGKVVRHDNADVLPWEEQEARYAQARSNTPVPGGEGAEARKHKRLSIRLSRR